MADCDEATTTRARSRRSATMISYSRAVETTFTSENLEKSGR